MNKTRGEGEYGDLVHDTFLALQRANPVFSPTMDQDAAEAPLRPFILGVAYNVYRNHLRASNRRTHREIDLGVHTLGELQPGASSAIRARRQAQALMDGLRSIPVDDQILLELKYFECLSFQQISEVLGAAMTSLNGRISRAKERLRQRVRTFVDSEEECGSDALETWATEVRARLTQRSTQR